MTMQSSSQTNKSKQQTNTTLNQEVNVKKALTNMPIIVSNVKGNRSADSFSEELKAK